MTKNLCLLFHGLKLPSEQPLVHKELFVNITDCEHLIKNLLDQGYQFTLPDTQAISSTKQCSITFDDGYECVSHFDYISKKYSIPYIIFVNTYNVIKSIPFIWDIWGLIGRGHLNPSSNKYKNLYQEILTNPNFSSSVKTLSEHPLHKPFSEKTLLKILENPLAHVAPHTHYHQPLINYTEEEKLDLQENLKLLESFPQVMNKDLSLPCGIHSRKTLRKLSKNFDKIYTIEGGSFSPNQKVINRISLLNPEVGGSLIHQIKRSFSLKLRIRRAFPFLVQIKNKIVERPHG
jgi:hypothetical protein